MCTLKRDFLATLCSARNALLDQGHAPTYMKKGLTKIEWAAPNSNTLLPSLFDIRFRRVFLVCLPCTDLEWLYLHSKLPAGVGKAQVDAGSSGREHGSSLHPEREQAGQRGKAIAGGTCSERSCPLLPSCGHTQTLPVTPGTVLSRSPAVRLGWFLCL